jgi:hypothetical protein
MKLVVPQNYNPFYQGGRNLLSDLQISPCDHSEINKLYGKEEHKKNQKIPIVKQIKGNPKQHWPQSS